MVTTEHQSSSATRKCSLSQTSDVGRSLLSRLTSTASSVNCESPGGSSHRCSAACRRVVNSAVAQQPHGAQLKTINMCMQLSKAMARCPKQLLSYYAYWTSSRHDSSRVALGEPSSADTQPQNGSPAQAPRKNEHTPMTSQAAQHHTRHRPEPAQKCNARNTY